MGYHHEYAGQHHGCRGWFLVPCAHSGAHTERRLSRRGWVLGIGIPLVGRNGGRLLGLVGDILPFRSVVRISRVFVPVDLCGNLNHSRMELSVVSCRAVVRPLFRIVRYAAGFIDQDGFIDERLPGYKQLADTLNEHKDTNVLMTASRMFYFVKDNDRRVILDSVLDTFDCLDLERNDALTLGRLRALHVGYMLIGQGFLTADTDVIRDRAARFEEFAKANLANVTYDQESMLFKVPQ